MSDNLVNLLESGIRAESVRQSVIANNLANMNTPGYRRFDIKFEELLAKAIESGESIDPKSFEPEVYQPKTDAINAQGNDVNLHSEVGELVKNSLKHKAYVRLLKSRYARLDLAMRIG